MGYDCLNASSRVVALLGSGGEPVDRLEGDGFMVTLRTPFYGESGGQAGDRGRVVSPTGTARVLDALKPAPSLSVHKVEMSNFSRSRRAASTFTASSWTVPLKEAGTSIR